MASERNYRKEAVSARRAARETLRSLREARRQSKVRAQKPGSPKKSDQGSLIEPDAFFSINPAPPDPLPEDADRCDAPASELAAAMDRTAETAPLADDAAGHENQDPATGKPDSIENEIGYDPAECSAEPVTDDVDDGGKADAGQSDEQVGSDDPALLGMDDLGAADPNSDLFDLPGAGAGIVWMFHQCGIRTLSDLACADAQKLSAKLGVVGHILNIQPWITYAIEVEAESAG